MTTPLSFLPSLGMTGFYSLRAPYDKLISVSSQYRCEGVRSLSAAVADGQDPLNNVYLANGDTQDNFNLDLQSNVSLITVSAAAGTLLVFPSSALLKVPSGDGVVYRNMVLVAPLSALPEDYNLTELQNEVMQMILAKFGIRAATYITTVGAATVLTNVQHEAVMAARTAQIESSETLVTKNLALTGQLATALEKLALLENYVKANLPP